MLRLLRRGLATRTLSADEMIARGQFIKRSFQLFDLNSDKKIELHEVETAYLHNSAGSHVVRMLEETGELGGKGVTWELLEDFDLIRAWKNNQIQTTGELAGEDPVVFEPQFTRWMTGVLDAHMGRKDALEGAQDMME